MMLMIIMTNSLCESGTQLGTKKYIMPLVLVAIDLAKLKFVF